MVTVCRSFFGMEDNTDAGRVAFLIPVQLAKAPDSIFVTLSGIVTFTISE